MKYLDGALYVIENSDRVGITLMRVAIATVFIWIGALKFFPYEADSITPFVANNPIMSLFYEHPEQYKAHLTHEGELVPQQREWQRENNTYGFSDGLGVVEITIGVLVLLHPVSLWVGGRGARLLYTVCNIVVSDYYARSLGSGDGRRAAWLSVSLRCGTSRNQRCDVARRGAVGPGGFGSKRSA
jgi:reactive chlorine resistance protein C